MKLVRYSLYFLCLGAFLILLTTCKKEESDEELKEAVIRTLLQDISVDSIRNDVVWLQNMGTRFCLAGNHRDVALKIRKKFRDIGYPDAELDSFWVVKTFRNVMYEQKQYNVIASVEGTDYPDSVCVVGGHYDNILRTEDLTVVPGANDNASGTAAVLEIARVLKENEYKPKSTIIFIAFGAEEIGLYGSKDFAGYPNGFEVTFSTYSGSITSVDQMADAIAGYLAKVGIKAKLVQLQYSAMREKFQGGKVQLAFWTWGSNSINDVSAIVDYWFMHTTDDIARDPKVLALLTAAGGEMNVEKRKALYKEALQIIARQAYTVPLFTWVTNYCFSSELDFTPHSDETPRFFLAKWK